MSPASRLATVLETDRLILRVPVLADFGRYAEMLASEDAARFIGGTLLRAPAWRKFLQMPGAWTVQGFAMFSVLEKASGRWLGQMGPWRPEGWPGNEIGYAFHPDAWGQGFAVEAGIAARDWAFETLGWNDIIHCIDPGNVPSQKVAQRLGSRKRGPGTLPPPFEDVPIDVWGQTRSEWLAAKRDQPASCRNNA